FADGKLYCEYILNGKPPILLIHGFVSSTYTFNRLIPLLQKSFSVIAIDLLGFGQSEKSTTFIYSYTNYAALVAEVIASFHLKNVTIRGHYMGGHIGLDTARRTHGKGSKVILLASSGYLKSANTLLIYSSYLPLFYLIAKRIVKNQSVGETLKNVLCDHSLL